MDEQKLIRRKKKALNGSNRRALAEAYNDLATFYYNANRYEDALEEYKHEANIHKEMGSRLEWATSSRMIAEMYTLLGEFDKALKHEERHLATAKELSNLVEEQRALATLGRIYLLQAQSISNNELAMRSLQSAERAFMKGLVICENLKGHINTHELMDMRARLLLNIGVVLENLDQLDKALSFIKKAESICSSQELFEVLQLCYKSEGLLFSNKKNDFTSALNCFSKALEVAKRVENKIGTQCETLALKADVLCKMSDYHSAKQVLLKAFKLKTPDLTERENIEKNLKIVATICYTEDLLVTTNPTDHATLKKLYEKLGDAVCALCNYADGVKYYLKMLEQAQLGGDDGKALIPIYVSLYQTYKDMGDYKSALVYYEKEYELIKEIPKEAFTTLANIAEALFCAKRPYCDIEEACLKARDEAVKCGSTKYEARIYRHLYRYQIEYGESEKVEATKASLKAIGCDDFDNLESSSEDECNSQSQEEECAAIGDDICLEELTEPELSDNNEEIDVETKREARKTRGSKGYVIKKNMKGETQLHVACISGKKLLVDRLLARGHPVNVRDNAGWLPLHEAAIHGHLDIVKELVRHGAHVNDRGGSNCDGITPLYDAACSGHLDIVQYLLENGAIPSHKTDYNETPLQALQKWRKSVILNKEEELEYKNICNKLNDYLEKNYVDLKSPVKNITPRKYDKVITPPSTSKYIDSIDSIIRRRRVLDYLSDEDTKSDVVVNNIDSDSDLSDKVITNIPPKKDKSVKEYREAISALRNRNVIDDLPDVEIKKTDKLRAFLDDNEVDDDWLEDDLGNSKQRKRKCYENAIENRAKKPALTKHDRSSDKSNSSRSRINDLIDSENSSDLEIMAVRENVNPRPNTPFEIDKTCPFNDTVSRDSRKNIKKRFKTQISLLKAGFRRNKSPESSESSNNNSDCESFVQSIPKDILNSSANRKVNYTLSKRSSNESVDSGNTTTKSNLSLSRHNSNERMQKTTSQAILPNLSIMPPASVRVKIEDKTLLIPLKIEVMNSSTINWLVEEVKTRYHKLCGLRPTVRLQTLDGAILSEEDPLTLIMGVNELKATIDGIRPDPAEEHYIQCCSALSIPVDEEIQLAIGRSYSTRRLTLGTNTLSLEQVRPLFRALMHQNHITSLILSDNNLCDDGLKYLIDCLCTLRQLNSLDVSNNNITSDGVKMLLGMFEKSARPICTTLEHIDMSSNPISDEGFRNILNITTYLKLKSLKIGNCQISENAITETNRPAMNFDYLDTLDLSHNALKLKLACDIVTKMSPNLIIDLELENIKVDGTVVGFLSSFLDSAKELKLRRLNLSKCKLVDSQFMRIFRSLSRARNLQTISLKHNALTFIALKKLLQRQPPIPNINLEHCNNIFKYAQDSDFQIWLPAINFGRCVPDINVSPVSNTDEERNSVKLFSKTWLNCFKGRGVIEHCGINIMKFTCR